MPLDMRYVQYCHPNSRFYARTDNQSSPRLDSALHIPSDWDHHSDQPWTYASPPRHTLPAQGWKVHVSATLENRERVLERTATYCFQHALAFKYLSTQADFFSMHGKYSDRASAGKFITIYPINPVEFEATLVGLEKLLRNEKGPYILSDRRWGTSPIYYRYGAFLPPSEGTAEGGTLIDPLGNTTPDIRSPRFTMPEWVEAPAFLNFKDESQSDASQFPFDVVEALHFSSGGGVYVGRALSSDYVPEGTELVLKEARPYTAYDSTGSDAVARLRHEWEVLSALQHTKQVPRLYGFVKIWEHYFLLMERISGSNLKRETMLRTPILRTAPWNLIDQSFLDWLEQTVNQTDLALRQFHESGWLLGDIHPKNIIMRNGTDPIFVDFEFAHSSEDCQWRIDQVAPGYGPKTGLYGVAADEWSLGITQLDTILPQAVMADQGNEGVIPLLLDTAQTKLGVSSAVRKSIERKLLPESTDSDHPDIQNMSSDEVIRRLVAGAVSQMRFSDAGPAMPGDIDLFESHGREAALSYPNGLTGALATLSQAGLTGSDEFQSLSQHWVQNRLGAIKTNGFRGRDGIEYGLRAAGLAELAQDVARLEVAPPLDPTYWSGWAGRGLNALSAGRVEDALRASHELQRMLTAGHNVESAGLFHGWSGAAILWSRLSQLEGGNTTYRSLASSAIGKDLQRCTLTKNDTLEVDEGWRTLPYLGTGSAGIALAIYELRRSTGQDMFDLEFQQLTRATTFYQCAQGTFAYGISGFIATLNYVGDQVSDVALEALTEATRTLRLFLIPQGDSLHVRGNQGLRLSCDFATGSLGVAATLSALRGDWSGIPLL